jgi:hypothetical protein
METDVPIRVNGNVPNRGSITNLPEGCCVEVPCLVDANGVQATHVGALPTQLAALNRTNVNVQELIVEAALSGDTDAVHHAVALDPLTARSARCRRSTRWSRRCSSGRRNGFRSSRGVEGARGPSRGAKPLLPSTVSAHKTGFRFAASVGGCAVMPCGAR